MSDLTREQLEACLTTFPGEPDWFSAMDEDAQEAFVRNVFVMALRALDAADETATLRAALLARGVNVPAYYTRTDAERAADAQIHARRITRGEAEWMTFSARAHHEAQKPCAEVPHE